MAAKKRGYVLCFRFCAVFDVDLEKVHGGRAAIFLIPKYNIFGIFVVPLFQDVDYCMYCVELDLDQAPQQAVATSKPVVNHHCYYRSLFSLLYNASEPIQ